MFSFRRTSKHCLSPVHRDANQHIGSQWNGERVKSMDSQACKMRSEGLGDDKMNVELHPCGKHEAKAAGRSIAGDKDDYGQLSLR